jgi:hypothetical protein
LSSEFLKYVLDPAEATKLREALFNNHAGQKIDPFIF